MASVTALAVLDGVANLVKPIVDTGIAIGEDIVEVHLEKTKADKRAEKLAQKQKRKKFMATCGTSKCDKRLNLVCSFGLKKDEFNNDINEGVCVEKGRTRVYGELCNDVARCTKEWKCREPKVTPAFSFQAPKIVTKICGECEEDHDCPGGRCEEGNSAKKICKAGQRKTQPGGFAFAKCVTPFIWNDMLFHGCTKVGRRSWESSWCPTKVNHESRYTVDEGFNGDGVFITPESDNWKACPK